MITLDDCTAFCDADAKMVEEIACHQHLPMIAALACAHARVLSANDDFLPMLDEPIHGRMAA